MGCLNETLFTTSINQFCFFSHHRVGPVHNLSLYFQLQENETDATVLYESYHNSKKILQSFLRVFKCWNEMGELVRLFMSEVKTEMEDEKLKYTTRAKSLINVKNKRLNSADDLLRAFFFYSTLRALYEQLRDVLPLPSISTLKKITSVAKNISDESLFPQSSRG